MRAPRAGLIVTSAALVLGAAAYLAGPRVACWLRGRCNPRRHHLGGFVCKDCARVGLALSDLGFDIEGDYVTGAAWREPEAER